MSLGTTGFAKRSSHFFRVGLCVVAGACLLTSCSSKKGRKSGEGIDDAAALSENDLNGNNARFGSNSIPRAEGEGPYKDIQFIYDSHELSSESRSDLEANARIMDQSPGSRFTLEGHCDERGTEEYNLSLGQARAKSVKDALAALGISPSRLDTISYGANLPIDPGHNESAYARNRRVHIAVGGATTPRAAVAPQGDESARGRFETPSDDTGRY
jgi:peptidoglycan-associated lipoprotein